MFELRLKPIIKTDSIKYAAAYELLQDFKADFQGREIIIPKFFQYDGASIPAFAWPIMGSPFNPKFMKAAVVHDWLFYVHLIDRHMTNLCFYQLLIKSGVHKIKALIMRIAVECFSICRWENDELDFSYMVKLKQRIIEDGRNPLHYGLSIDKAAQ